MNKKSMWISVLYDITIILYKILFNLLIQTNRSMFFLLVCYFLFDFFFYILVVNANKLNYSLSKHFNIKVN